MQALLLGFFLGFLLPSVDSAVNTTGDQTVLVVAVKITDANKASKTKEEISGRVFRDSSNPPTKPGWPNMAGIYQTCSHGKLNIIKTSDRNPANVNVLPEGNSAEPITNGATTVTLSSAANEAELTRNLKDTLTKEFNVGKIEELADHIILCFPRLYVNTSYTVLGTEDQLIRMSDDRCLDPFVLAHEFGHGIGLVHSGQVNSSEKLTGGYNNDEYGDESCTMGHAFLKNQALQEKFEIGQSPVPPLPVCFNGLKSWTLGWFEDKHRHTFKAADKTWTGKLIGQVDYPKSDGTEFKIILKLEDDYYIMFHRVPGNFPADLNYDNNNTVTIVSPKSPDGNGRSNLEKVLRANDSFQKDNFKVTVKSININQDPAFAEVVVEMLEQDTAVPTSTPPTTAPPMTSLPTATTTTAVPTSTPPTTSPPTTSLPTATTTIAVPTTAEPTGSPSNNPTTTVPTARPTKSASTGKSGKSMLGKSTLRGKSGKSIQNTSKSGKSKLGKSTSREPV